MASFHVWASELRTLDIEVDAHSPEDAERRLRRRLASGATGDDWVSSAVVIKVGRGTDAVPLAPGPAHEQQPKLVTTQAAASALGIGRTTVYGLIKTGELRSVAVGRRRLVSVQALDEYVQLKSR